jgi:dTDP-4-amino-4,6-dideoxygalactose transaminase
MTSDRIEFVDLHAQRARLGTALDEAIIRVLDHGQFIMGPEVADLETALAARAGTIALSCGSGTDALVLALMALGAGPGDAVLVPTFTFAATAEAVALVGATPVFVDVIAATFNMDPSAVGPACDMAASLGLRPVGMIPVDLFGLPADYSSLTAVARDLDLWIVADAAQSFGAELDGRPVGSLAPVTTTSFFPAKPLGCYGDGGALFVTDPDMAELVRSLRVHGQGAHKYENVRVGMNGRLDTIQAAVLLQKLRIFDDELARRDAVAARYTAALAGSVATPAVPVGSTTAWAQYTVLVDRRDEVAATLRDRGIPTAVYYPVPLHRQPAYAASPSWPDELPVAEQLAPRVLSLPMHPYLEPPTQDRIIESLLDAASPR